MPGATLLSIDAPEVMALAQRENPTRFQVFNAGIDGYLQHARPHGLTGYAHWVGRHRPTLIARADVSTETWPDQMLARHYRYAGRGPSWSWFVSRSVGLEELCAVRRANRLPTRRLCWSAGHHERPLAARGRRPARLSPTRGERANTLAYLRNYRLTFEMKCEGLDAEQLARRSVPPSALSLLGLVRHLAQVEHHWSVRVLQGVDTPQLYKQPDDRDADFDGAVADPAVVDEAWTTYDAGRRRRGRLVRPGHRPGIG